MSKDHAIGFIGLGAMGSRMVSRLLHNGHKVTVFDLNQQAIEAAKKAGATSAGSIADMANNCEIILFSLPTPDVVEELTVGTDGLIHGSRVKVVVDLSTTGATVENQIAARLAEKNIHLIGAPVSGGPAGVEAATLAVMASGNKQAFETAQPLLASFAKNIFYLGTSAGLGQTAKVANNMLAATGVVAVAEALAMGMKNGLDPKILLDVINKSSGRSFATEVVYPPGIEDGSFQFGFRTALMKKDLSLYSRDASALGLPQWVSGIVEQFYRYLVADGQGDHDFSEAATVFANWVNLSYPFEQAAKTDE